MPRTIGTVTVTNNDPFLTFTLRRSANDDPLFAGELFAQSDFISVEPGETVTLTVVAREYFEGDSELVIQASHSLIAPEELKWTFTNTCAPPGPAPAPGLQVYDTPVKDPQIPSVAPKGFADFDGAVLISGGEDLDGHLEIRDIETGDRLSTVFQPGFGNPLQIGSIFAMDAFAPADQQFSLVGSLISVARFNANWGLAAFLPSASDIRVLAVAPNCLATSYVRTMPSSNLVRVHQGSHSTNVLVDGDLPIGFAPSSADQDAITGDWYFLLFDKNDRDRTYLYRRPAAGGALELVREIGVGGTRVRIAGDVLVTAASGVVSVFKREDDAFAFDQEIDAGPLKTILARTNGDNTVLAWATGAEIRVVVLAADCTVKVDESFGPPNGMDRVNHLAWLPPNGLVGTGSLGDDGKWFAADDWTDALGLDECTRFADEAGA